MTSKASTATTGRHSAPTFSFLRLESNLLPSDEVSASTFRFIRCEETSWQFRWKWETFPVGRKAFKRVHNLELQDQTNKKPQFLIAGRKRIRTLKCLTTTVDWSFLHIMLISIYFIPVIRAGHPFFTDRCQAQIISVKDRCIFLRDLLKGVVGMKNSRQMKEKWVEDKKPRSKWKVKFYTRHKNRLQSSIGGKKWVQKEDRQDVGTFRGLANDVSSCRGLILLT